MIFRSRYAKDGRPDVALVEEIACRWRGEDGALLAALKTVGFLDDDGSVHDWDEWTGSFLEQLESRREAARKAMKSKRKRSHNVRTTLAQRDANVRTTLAHREEKSREEERREEDNRNPAASQPVPPSGQRSWHGIKGTSIPILRMLDRRLRQRDPALALPEKIGERITKAFNSAMSKLPDEATPDRVRFAVNWAFDDAWHADKLTSVEALIGSLRKIISGSADTWTALKDDLAFLDQEVSP